MCMFLTFICTNVLLFTVKWTSIQAVIFEGLAACE